MKSLITTLLIALSVSYLYAQNSGVVIYDQEKFKNFLKHNPLGLIDAQLQFSYERVIKDRIGIQFSYGRISNRWDMWSSPERNGYIAIPEIKFYFDRTGDMGTYLSAFYRRREVQSYWGIGLTRWELGEDNIWRTELFFPKRNRVVQSFGANVGYQFLLSEYLGHSWRIVVVDIFGGFHFKNQKVNRNFDENEEEEEILDYGGLFQTNYINYRNRLGIRIGAKVGLSF